MKKSLMLSFIIISTFFVGYAQQDSLKISEFDLKLLSLGNKINELEKKNDSLMTQHLIYKIKEDFYFTAISDQTTKYSLITGTLIALLALISYATFKYELKKLEEKFNLELKNHSNRDKEVLDNHHIGLARSYVNGGNSNQILKIILEERKDWIEASYYNLFAAYNHFLASCEFLSSSEDDKESIASSELKLVESILEETIDLISKIENEKKFSSEKSKRIKKWFDKITCSENDKLKYLIAKIRVQIIEKTTTEHHV